MTKMYVVTKCINNEFDGDETKVLSCFDDKSKMMAYLKHKSYNYLQFYSFDFARATVRYDKDSRSFVMDDIDDDCGQERYAPFTYHVVSFNAPSEYDDCVLASFRKRAELKKHPVNVKNKPKKLTSIRF